MDEPHLPRMLHQNMFWTNLRLALPLMIQSGHLITSTPSRDNRCEECGRRQYVPPHQWLMIAPGCPEIHNNSSSRFLEGYYSY
jgi:hypothetical protein